MIETREALLDPLGWEQLINLASVVLLNSPELATKALIQAENNHVRWADSGVDPTASTGMRLERGGTLTYIGKLSHLKFIQEGPNAKLNVAYYR